MRYLEFAASDDGQDRGSWEAMASVRAAELEAARAEAQQLLAAAQREAPGPRGPEEDGGCWDTELQEQSEADGWTTITVTLTGPWDWGASLVQRFSDID
ncbi:MAG: hypothetical protein ACK4F7_05000 [Inhella sp.]